MSKTVPTFERLSSESDAAWQAFCCYRDMGPGRTQNGAWRVYADARGLTARAASSQFRAWHKGNDWDVRCLAWDREHAPVVGEVENSVLARHADELVAFAARAAMGAEEITKEQASVLNKLLDKILVASPKPTGGAAFNGPTQINFSNLSAEQAMELVTRLKG